MAVRSAELFRINLLPVVSTLIFTCPAGVTALVKNIRAVQTGPVGTLVTMRTSRAGVSCTVFAHTFNINEGYSELCFLVLEPGDELFAQGSTSPSVSLSGYGALLAGVA